MDAKRPSNYKLLATVAIVCHLFPALGFFLLAMSCSENLALLPPRLLAPNTQEPVGGIKSTGKAPRPYQFCLPPLMPSHQPYILTSFATFHCTRQLAGPFRIQELSYPSGAHLSDVIDGDMTFKLSIDEGCYCSANTLDLNQLAANDTDC